MSPYQIAPFTPEHEKEIRNREELAQQQAAEREAILQKRESLHRLFPEEYSPDVSVLTDGKVEIMFKLSYGQAQNLARLMKGHDL
ncbi:MAG: hypothetical protein DMG30_12970 [Acidobacteria bacterium]|nr:MAG: hypothetical protein DMG30_12970 [Acidobacteriota bacterium]